MRPDTFAVMSASDYDAVADLYDVVVRSESDLPLFVEAAAEVGGPVLELTAGTGRVSIALAAAGVDVVCVDSSPAMLEVLARKFAEAGLRAETIIADVRTLALGRRFELVLFPFHALHEVVDAEERRGALAAIRAHVAPGGRFICALHNPPVRAAAIEATGGAEALLASGSDGEGRVVELRGRFVIDRSTGIVTGAQRYFVNGVARAPLNVRFRLFDPASFELDAVDAGFDVEARFGDYRRSPFDAGSSPHAIYVLRG